MAEQVPDLPVMEFASAKAWDAWLAKHHASSPGVWLKIAKKGTGVATVTMPEVIETALCWGWIDGLRHRHDDVYFRQRMTPRKRGSRWSQHQPRQGRGAHRGRTHAAGRAPGGRRGASRRAVGRRLRRLAHHDVPDDLTRALRRNAAARRAFEQLDSRNRYAILYRIQDAKRAETRARRIEQFVTMLAEGRTIH